MSSVYRIMPVPDWAATTTEPLRGAPERDPAAWGRAVFDVDRLSSWGRGLFAVRDAAARVLRIPPSDPAMLAVDHVEGDEAIIDTDDEHLHFVAGVRAADGLLHVTTAVTFHNRVGRLYFVPVRFLHDQLTRNLMRSALDRSRTRS